MLFAPIKGRSRCYASLHCKEDGYERKWNIHNTGKTLYIWIEANNKSCKIMWRLNTSTCIRYTAQGILFDTA